ncbi:acyl-CoA dehydrogenase [Lysinibacillus sphaericus]|uniref:Acyl-CoA dehydrogenase n=4 Tax=Lysinibacillus TaxID=400634 RepID=A0A2S0K2W9_LYSSH|nr:MULTISPECIES: acyl-CoA dehydrogenase family protein [Lysinibacillus]AHN21168.1 acyl-CoA dehydrogenase [Lysinibacillus varians]AVK97717.1 acyl-CoA dehydrogenase [Lysinibacillus sphaericus]MED4543199.1 acyl-CoA dehydrogenase family protein [Lysinibacillus sphaericus]TKI20950.1 acyl-CoA dehydrogenase [Lysinibacillus sphaericus]TKI48097.1 acyl-CoA dehydrogenase [Lysinibacillus tabacifolii]
MFQLPTVQFTEAQEQFRLEVRAFLHEELAKGTFVPKCDSWLSGDNPEFSKLIGQKGWIGITWPKKYGGQERSTIDRYILTEEFLAIGAPVAAHWFADRQTGPLLLRYGTEQQRAFFLPQIVKGECYFGIGLSEPNSGSDLASVSTRAEKVEGGWIVNGQKIWTSNAHLCHYMVTLVRTSPYDGKHKHAGLSQLIVDLQADGITVVPIKFLTGEHHYNEVFFDNVFVPDNMVVGEIGNGWVQGLAELAFERSGPERILSTFPLIDELIQELKRQNNIEGLKQASKVVARLWSLRNLSIGVAQLLATGNGDEVSIPAALVKALGTKFEQSIPEITRLLVQTYPTLDAQRKIDRLMAESILHAPGFTIRGGTSEVLYGIVAKGVVAQ